MVTLLILCITAVLSSAAGESVGPPDCNGNGVPDDQDISSGASLDCNGNGVPDECDIATGDSLDCNNNGVPDECDIASGFSNDCNTNDVPDECDIASGTSGDCNTNGRPDECDIAAAVGGPVFISGDDADDFNHCQNGDCGGLYPALLTYITTNATSEGEGILAIGVNGETALNALLNWNSATYGGPDAPLTIVNDAEAILNVPFTAFKMIYVPSAAHHTFGGITDLQRGALLARKNDIRDFINVQGGGLLTLTQAEVENGWSWLPIDLEIQDQIHIQVCPTQELFDLVPDANCQNMTHFFYHGVFTGPEGLFGMRVLATSSDDPAGQPVLIGGRFVTFGDVGSQDCNNNGIPDECDIASQKYDDMDFNGVPDVCDPDCNGNGVPDAVDILLGTSEDCNVNHIPDECDLARGIAFDCNGNGRPDECDIADGDETDDNNNGIPDSCEDCNGNGEFDTIDIASGTSFDCNNNGVPDECDAASGVSTDCNNNGIPDECDVLEGLASVPASGLETDDNFGSAVAISGEFAIVGATGDDDLGSSAGAAYILRSTGASWVIDQKITASDGAAGDFFGASVDIEGNQAVVGAYSNDGEGTNAGAAYIFQRIGTNWIQRQKLTPDDIEGGDLFGFSVAISNQRVLIGAYLDDASGSNSGSAYVFLNNGSTWSQQAKITPTDGAAGQQFGVSVGLDDNVAVIGAWMDAHAGGATGAAYIFRRDQGSWNEEAKLVASDADSGDFFGLSVDIKGNVAIAGAFGDDQGGTDAGAAYVYQFDEVSWTEQDKLVPADASSGMQFGAKVAISNRSALVGAWRDDEVEVNAGAAYTFSRLGGNWPQQIKLTSVTPEIAEGFGIAVALDGNTLMIGAGDTDVGEVDTGGVYASINFGSTADCNGNGNPDGCDILGGASNDANLNGVPDECECPADINGDLAIDVTDLLTVLSAWGACPPPCPPACDGDIDGDCVINVTDLLTVLSAWGPCQ